MGVQQINTSQEQELEVIRKQRDEQARKELALTNRLNAAKKKEADKTNLAEDFQLDIQSVEKELRQVKEKLNHETQLKQTIEKQLHDTQIKANERIQYIETSLTEERKLNEERKH